MRRVVVTGLGMVSPVGRNVEESWKSALDSKSGVDLITLFDLPEDLKVKIAAEVKNFDPGDSVDAKERPRMSRFCQFAAAAAKEAMEDSGLVGIDLEGRANWGVSVGVGLGGLKDIEDTSILIKEKGSRRVSPFFLPYVIPNMASGIVSRNYGLKGPNICTTTACASGTHAIGEALLFIRDGRADVMVAGGAEAAISPVGVSAFANMKALSKGGDDFKKASRPFDRERDGFVMGEGCGLVVLEELEHAQRRGAKIYAELVGYGLSGDAYHITAPAPDHEGGFRCMEMAIKTAGITPEQMSYINAHGTSTKMNDHLESVAIANLFGKHAKNIPVSSTKGVTGHCLGAAGGIEAVFTALSVYSNVIPPTANYEFPDPDCPLDYVGEGARELAVECAMSNSFGFGGTNASIVMRKFS